MLGTAFTSLRLVVALAIFNVTVHTNSTLARYPDLLQGHRDRQYDRQPRPTSMARRGRGARQPGVCVRARGSCSPSPACHKVGQSIASQNIAVICGKAAVSVLMPLPIAMKKWPEFTSSANARTPRPWPPQIDQLSQLASACPAAPRSCAPSCGDAAANATARTTCGSPRTRT